MRGILRRSKVQITKVSAGVYNGKGKDERENEKKYGRKR
jgi:hypothetical protein